MVPATHNQYHHGDKGAWIYNVVFVWVQLLV